MRKGLTLDFSSLHSGHSDNPVGKRSRGEREEEFKVVKLDVWKFVTATIACSCCNNSKIATFANLLHGSLMKLRK